MITLNPQQLVDAIWPLLQKRIINMLSISGTSIAGAGVAGRSDDMAVLVRPGTVPGPWESGRTLVVSTGVTATDSTAAKTTTLAFDTAANLTMTGTHAWDGGDVKIGAYGLQLAVGAVTSSPPGTTTPGVYRVDCTSGAVTITLDSAVSYPGAFVFIKKIDGSGNNLTIDASGAETIDDAATITLTTQYEAVTLYSDGVEWWIL